VSVSAGTPHETVVSLRGDAGALPDSGALFDVEPFRVLPKRLAVARMVAHPTVVLGSTQRPEIVDPQRSSEMHAEVVGRRGGGGAVLLQPDDHLWIEAWIPRADPLWEPDVAAAAAWVGAWWRAGLTSLGIDGTRVHDGRSIPGDHGALVCFSGQGPGEVFRDDRKIVGVSQWRGREGALFHACAYAHWDPRPLVHLLEVDPATEKELVADLDGVAVGVDDLAVVAPGPHGALALLRDVLLSSFVTWGEDRPAHSVA
jgi:lipoate---protein ligase